MEYFLGSVKLMLIIYALAAVISLVVAWVIRCTFTCIRMMNNKEDAAVKASPDPAGRT
jgi:hypothetical protein